MEKQPTTYKPSKDKIAIYNKNGEELIVAFEDILYAEAQGSYCLLTYYFANEVHTTKICKALHVCEKQLLLHNFIRIHHSFMIHKNHILKINHHEHCVLMRNDKSITFSKPYYDAMHHLFDRFDAA